MKLLLFIVIGLFSLRLFAADVKCPALETGSELSKAAITVGVTGDRKLIVCGYQEPNRPEEFSEFAVYSVEKNGDMSSPLFQGGAFETFEIKNIKDGFQLTELLRVAGQERPAFQSQLTCGAKKCSVGREVCIYKPTKGSTSSDGLKEIESYISGKNKGKNPDETIVNSVADLAYQGNKKAQRIFFHRPDSLALDAAPSEDFEAAQTRLGRLKERKCLP